MRLLVAVALLAVVALGAEQQRLMEDNAAVDAPSQHHGAEQQHPVAVEEHKDGEKSKKHSKRTVRPVIVTKFEENKPKEDDKHKETVTAAALEEGVDHKANLETLEAHIKEQQDRIKDLGEKLEKTYHNKVRLQILKDMTSAVSALNKAQAYLKKIDAKIATYKKKVQHYAERAEEVVEGMKRSEEEHKRELAESNKVLGNIHKGLAAAEVDMRKLAARRQTVQTVEKKWANLVAVLKNARENYAATHDENGNLKKAPAPVKKPASATDDFAPLPEPPNPQAVLSQLGLSGSAGLRGAAAPAAHAAPNSVAAAAHRFSGVDIEKEAEALDAELQSEDVAEEETQAE